MTKHTELFKSMMEDICQELNMDDPAIQYGVNDFMSDALEAQKRDEDLFHESFEHAETLTALKNVFVSRIKIASLNFRTSIPNCSGVV